MKNKLISLLLLGAIFGGCQKTKTKKELSLMLDPNTPEYMSKNVVMTVTENTKLNMKMEAALQLRYSDGNEHFPEGIFITTYDPKGEKQSTLVADSAIYYEKEHVYKAMGNVVLIDLNKEQTLETDTLNYNKNNGDIYTDTKVKITADGLITYGTGLKANQHNPDDYEILNVEGSAYID
ncbi:LPS export ABC transporter periplasmic protein LptC [Algivirga pacifica]|uniref:LPS export ABC transporter periplasmic protein LptC n=1 Tax=Algivirga pacifica TaxID=1162670 RepID=A0ABP9DP09_9BACT